MRFADICRQGHSSATTSSVREPRISHLSSSYGRSIDVHCDSDRCLNRDATLSNLFYFAGKHKLAAQQFFLVRKNHMKGITDIKLLCRPAAYSTISVGEHMLRRCEICCVSLNNSFFLDGEFLDIMSAGTLWGLGMCVLDQSNECATK